MQEFAYSLSDKQTAQRRLNAPLDMIDAQRLIYAANGREVRAVYDMGVDIPIIARCTALEALERIRIDSGFAAACRGYVRLGMSPAGPVTADLESQ